MGFLESIPDHLARIESKLDALLARSEPSAEEFMTIDEVAAWLKVERHTVTSWLNRGILTRVKIGSTVRIARSEILDLKRNAQNAREI